MIEKRKLSKSSALITALVVLTGVGMLTAFAILYLSNERKNVFNVGSAQIHVEENDDSNTEPEKSNELTWKKEYENNEDSPYIADKKIVITSTKNDEYIKVMLVPGWRDKNGYICQLNELSDFAVFETEAKKMYLKNRNNQLIVTLNLDGKWREYWNYDAEQNCFHYKELLPVNASTHPLLQSVEISDTVYSLSEKCTFWLDVITDSVEQYGDVIEKRNF
ncbi:MAG: hypothetical protein IJ666_03935 [Ruminococcus sp.]|nr:hypothetical protein [Ruminococcus sp.]